MATIPRIVSQRSLDPGGVVSIPTGDPVGAALEQAGTKGVSLIAHYQDRVNYQERFQSLISFDEFSTKRESDKVAATQNMKPGAAGLHDGLVQNYDAKASEWLNTLPQSQRPEFEARLRAKREAYSIEAARLQKAESDRFETDGIKTRVDTSKQGILQSGPDAVPAFTKDVEELIDTSSLSPIQKEAAKKQLRAELEETGFRALAQRDPEAAQRVAKGWGVDKGFSGTAIDRTMQLLRDKEGFKSSTYWDVNADRVGYGSDTITDPDGKIRTVKAGDTVTREDAERDLRRRTQESLGQVQKAVGDEAFNRLTPNQQAAVGSVVYNYGRLPDSVGAAIRTGDAERIAQSIEGLQGHNNGVNRNRRLAEAALARSSGDGPVPGVYQADPRFANVPAEKRIVLAGNADVEANQQRAAIAARETADYNERLNALQTSVIDGKATAADVQQARKEGWLRDAGDIQKVLSAIATRDKATSDITSFSKAMADPSFAWNPVNKDQKDWIDAGFKSLGGDMPALQTIAEKTGIVPASAAVAMRGSLLSPDANRVQSALQTAANLTGGRYTDIFAGVEGGKELTEAGLTFRHLVYDRGLSAAEATKKIMEERTPEFERDIKARIKSEDVNAIVRKELKDGDIRSAFDPSFLGLAPNPQLTFNPEMRQRAMGDYEEIFREQFAKNGDVGRSKTLALEEMKRTWGVTEVSGQKTIIKYPPERAPAYAGVQNAAEHIAQQALAAIKDLNGVDVERSKLRMDEVRTTGERYTRGEPPTYILSYTDKNGVAQTIPRPFYADPGLMRDAQTAQRAAQSARIQQRVAIDADMADLSRAPFGVQ
ncbi:lysozyme [Tardiphaga sp.]|jgi:GH24 family phage-related lysozyme (muramidase)|uniref:lysozyme n=1 Tax=Tardiphaga sp. TaxID=1926292 RepID=UPI0037D9A3C1